MIRIIDLFTIIIIKEEQMGRVKNPILGASLEKMFDISDF